MVALAVIAVAVTVMVVVRGWPQITVTFADPGGDDVEPPELTPAIGFALPETETGDDDWEGPTPPGDRRRVGFRGPPR